MSAVPPDLAAKVEAANLRNHVKAVGEGATLAPATRQVFMTFAAKGDPDAMRDARENALLQKWLTAGRLSKEERAEIEHILPSSSAQPVENRAPIPSLKSNGYLRSADDYGHIGVARRTFFRWKSAGETNPDGPDLPPFDEPHLIEAWYERMKARGAFKHRFPKDVREAISEHLRGSPPKNASPAPAAGQNRPPEEASAPAKQVPSAFTADHGVAQGLKFEIEAEEKRVASLRVARDEAYQRQQLTEGDSYDRRYREALDALSLIQQRYLKIAAEEGSLIEASMVERALLPLLTTVVQSGMLLYDKIGPKLRAVTDHAEGRRIWRTAWIEHCNSLREGRFAPLLNLEALTA